jgi:AraC-like DNA-binding protein
MLHQVYIPAAPLDRFVEVFVYFEGVYHAHNVDRFLPNGDTEILIDFHDTPQYIYDNNTLKEIQACHHVWASGVRTEPITIPSGSGSSMMVIALKKGMAAPFFLVWGSDFGLLREHLLETSDVAVRFQLVEDFLLRKFRSKLNANPCIEFAMGEMCERPDAISIGRMNQKIGYSQKHFTEMFRRSVGVTPKSYLKIMRFQKAVKTIDAQPDLNWGEIALECGFYDQAHFIHDFKHFSGFTPEHYATIHTNYQNYIPVG